MRLQLRVQNAQLKREFACNTSVVRLQQNLDIIIAVFEKYKLPLYHYSIQV